MILFRDGKIEFDSPVVVGEIMTKTVIFDGMMSYIVFSPYWNLPKSIIEYEVLPGIEKNKHYLKNHNMEWNDGHVRQLSGKNNSLGLVKFMFPNSNDIYFHDSPAKSLFKREERALSHGCVRVGKARELAIKILENDKDWPVEKIDAAMNAGEETICSLKNKIPVYIGYFTAWVDEEGRVNFYKDVYERDEKLAELLFYK
jgi:murein L,D-transpeptidase YcbB/YkuD